MPRAVPFFHGHTGGWMPLLEVADPDCFCSLSARQAAMARHGLPQGVVLFGYGFDLNSTAIRKNPMGALEAFQLAFPLPHLPALPGVNYVGGRVASPYLLPV